MEKTALFHENQPAEKMASFPFGDGTTVYMANGLQPVSEETVLVEGQEPERVEVLAVLNPSVNFKQGDASDRLVYITRPMTDPGESADELPISFRRVRRTKDGLVCDRVFTSPADKPASVSFNEHRLRYVPHDKSHRGWSSLSFTREGGNYMSARLAVAESSQPVAETHNSRSERRRFLRDMKALGAAALAYFAIVPGGVVDRVTDPSHHAGSYIEKQFGSVKEAIDAIPREGGDIDGPGTYRSFEEQKQYLLEDEQSTLLATDRVAKTFESIDEHRFDEVKEASKKFEAANPDYSKTVSPEDREEFKTRLRGASTTQEAQAILNEFMSIYSSHVYTGEDLSLEESESSGYRKRFIYAGECVIDVLGALPAGMVRNVIGDPEGDSPIKPGGIVMDFRDKKDEVDGAYGSEAAYWDGGRIVLTRSFSLDIGLTLIHLANERKVISHELTHGLIENVVTDDDYTEGVKKPDKDTNYGALPQRAANLFSKLIYRPQFTSDYATSGAGEETAEAGSEIFIGEIEDPDHVGEFESRANRAKLAILIKLEESHPGITAYLITQLSPELLE